MGFFDTFVGPNDHGYRLTTKEPPHEQTPTVRHRPTSGSCCSRRCPRTTSAHRATRAVAAVAARVRSIARLPLTGASAQLVRHHELQAASAALCIAVDSGNFAGCLVALKQGLKEIANARCCAWRRGTAYSTPSTCSRRSSSPSFVHAGSKHDVPALLRRYDRMRREIVVGREHPERAYAAFRHCVATPFWRSTRVARVLRSRLETLRCCGAHDCAHRSRLSPASAAMKHSLDT